MKNLQLDLVTIKVLNLMGAIGMMLGFINGLTLGAHHGPKVGLEIGLPIFLVGWLFLAIRVPYRYPKNFYAFSAADVIGMMGWPFVCALALVLASPGSVSLTTGMIAWGVMVATYFVMRVLARFAQRVAIEITDSQYKDGILKTV